VGSFKICRAAFFFTIIFFLPFFAFKNSYVSYASAVSLLNFNEVAPLKLSENIKINFPSQKVVCRPEKKTKRVFYSDLIMQYEKNRLIAISA
jgi:hypothetical protein